MNGIDIDVDPNIEILRHYLETDLGKTVGAEYGEPQGRIKINNNLQLWE